MNTTDIPSITTRTKIALWSLIAPTVVIIISIGLFMVLNLVFNPTLWPTPDTQDPAPTPIVITTLNVILAIIGAAGLIAWLPGVITGITLLVTHRRATT